MSGSISIQNADGETDRVIMYHYSVDHHFLATYGVQMAAGMSPHSR